jgi:hypothetical protein
VADENIISWNVPNWITIVLMASIMYFLLGLVQKYMQQRVAQSGGSVASS